MSTAEDLASTNRQQVKLTGESLRMAQVSADAALHERLSSTPSAESADHHLLRFLASGGDTFSGRTIGVTKDGAGEPRDKYFRAVFRQIRRGAQAVALGISCRIGTRTLRDITRVNYGPTGLNPDFVKYLQPEELEMEPDLVEKEPLGRATPTLHATIPEYQYGCLALDSIIRRAHGDQPADAWREYYTLTVVELATKRSRTWKIEHARRFNEAALLGWTECLGDGLTNIKERIKASDEWGAGCSPTTADVANVASTPVPQPDGSTRSFYQHAHKWAFSTVENAIPESVICADNFVPETPFGQVRRQILRRRALSQSETAVQAELDHFARVNKARPAAAPAPAAARDAKARGAGVPSGAEVDAVGGGDEVPDPSGGVVVTPAGAPTLAGVFKGKGELVRVARAAGMLPPAQVQAPAPAPLTTNTQQTVTAAQKYELGTEATAVAHNAWNESTKHPVSGSKRCIRFECHAGCQGPPRCTFYHPAQDKRITRAEVEKMPREVRAWAACYGGFWFEPEIKPEHRKAKVAEIMGRKPGTRGSGSVPLALRDAAEGTHEMAAPLRRELSGTDVPFFISYDRQPWSSMDRNVFGADDREAATPVTVLESYFSEAQLAATDVVLERARASGSKYFTVWLLGRVTTVLVREGLSASALTPENIHDKINDALEYARHTGNHELICGAETVCAAEAAHTSVSRGPRGGECPITGEPPLVLHRTTPGRDGQPSVTAVVLLGVSGWTAVEAGEHVLDPHGVVRPRQCMVKSYSLLDIVADGVVPSAATIEERGNRAAAAFLWEADIKNTETTWPEFLTPTQALAHEAIADRLGWNDADVHFILAFDFVRLPASLEFSSKPWARMRAIAVTQRQGSQDIDIHVLDGVMFEVDDPLSWVGFLMCENNHARPLIAPACFRSVAGSLQYLSLAASRGVRVVQQKAVSWDVLLDGAATSDGFSVARCIVGGDDDDSGLAGKSFSDARSSASTRAGRAAGPIAASAGSSALGGSSARTGVAGGAERPAGDGASLVSRDPVISHTPCSGYRPSSASHTLSSRSGPFDRAHPGAHDGVPAALGRLSGQPGRSYTCKVRDGEVGGDGSLGGEPVVSHTPCSGDRPSTASHTLGPQSGPFDSSRPGAHGGMPAALGRVLGQPGRSKESKVLGDEVAARDGVDSGGLSSAGPRAHTAVSGSASRPLDQQSGSPQPPARDGRDGLPAALGRRLGRFERSRARGAAAAAVEHQRSAAIERQRSDAARQQGDRVRERDDVFTRGGSVDPPGGDGRGTPSQLLRRGFDVTEPSVCGPAVHGGTSGLGGGLADAGGSVAVGGSNAARGADVGRARGAGVVAARRAQGASAMAADATLPPVLLDWLSAERERVRPAWVPTACSGVTSFRAHGPDTAPAASSTATLAEADTNRWANASFDDVDGVELAPNALRLSKELAALAVEPVDWDEDKVYEKDTDHLKRLGDYLDKVIAKTDELVEAMQGVLGGAAAWRQQLYAIKPRPMTPENLDKVKPLLDSVVYDFLKDVAVYGARADVIGKPQHVKVNPHKSALNVLERMLVAVAKEFRMGVAFVVSEKSGKFAVAIEVCPMGAVSKKSPLTRVVLVEPRPIHNFRWGGNSSLNARTRGQPPTVCPQHYELAQQIVAIFFAFPGVKQLGTKRDVRKAFRQILMAIGGIKWFSTLLPTLDSMSTEGMIQAVLLALPFGWKNSPGLYGIAGWAMTQIQRRLGPGAEDWLSGDMLSFYSTAFVDDAVLLEPVLGTRLQLASDAYLYAGTGVLNKGFLQTAKFMEEGRWTDELMPWGRWLDLSDSDLGPEEVTFELPEVKIVAACELLDAESAQPGARKITMLQHESLFGNAQYWAGTSAALKVMVMSMAVMSTTRTPGWVDPVGSDTERELAWEEYDEVKLFLQVTMRDALVDPTLLKCSVLSLIDPYDAMRLPNGRESFWLNTDASGFEANGVMTGYDHLLRRAYVAWGNVYIAPLVAAFRNAPKADIIFVLEFLIVVAIACENAPKWVKKIVKTAVDSDNARRAINKKKSSNRYVRYLLKLLTRLEMRFDFRLVAYYINTKDNKGPDYLGRDEIVAFQLPGWEARAREIIEEFAPGFELMELDRLLKFLTSGPDVMRSYELPFETDAEERRLPSSLAKPWADTETETESASEGPSIRFVEGCAGKGTLTLAAQRLGVEPLLLIERDPMMARYLQRRFPEAHHHYELEIDEVAAGEQPSWAVHITKSDEEELAAGGGYPCQPYAGAGLMLGPLDWRAKTSTHGPVQLMANSGARWGVFENVGGKQYGEAVVEIDSGMEDLGLVRANKYPTPEDPVGLEMVGAQYLGAPGLRDRSVLDIEPDDAEATIGPCEPIEQHAPPNKPLSECLDPLEERSWDLVIPGVFHPISAPTFEPGRPMTDGYLECGGQGAPLFFGSLVELHPEFGKEGIVEWRVFEQQDGDWMRALPADKGLRGRHMFHADAVKEHRKQRRPAISMRSITVTNTAFGEGPEGPGKVLLHDTDMGLGVCRRLSGSELWRVMEDTEENLNVFKQANPHATDADIARAAGNSMSRRYADAVVGRLIRRMRAYYAAKRRLAQTRLALEIQRRWRGKKVRESVTLRRGARSRRAGGDATASARARALEAAWLDFVAAAEALGDSDSGGESVPGGGGAKLDATKATYSRKRRSGRKNRAKASTRGSGPKRTPSVEPAGVATGAQPAAHQRGVRRTMSTGDAGAQLAVGRYTLMTASVHKNTLSTYASTWKHWVIWRATRGEPLFLANELGSTDKQNAIIDFYVYFSYERNYAPNTLHVWKYAIRFMHILYEYDLEFTGMIRLKVVEKGWNRIYGAAHRKIPVTTQLIENIYEHGGLNMSRWDDLMAMLAIVLAFSFLWRSCEYATTGTYIDYEKCLRVGDALFANNDEDTSTLAPAPIAEFAAFHRTSKSDFLHQGASNNIFACGDGTPFCPIVLINRARVLKPQHFNAPDHFLLQCSDGKPVRKSRIESLLKEGSRRLGLPEEHITSHSLRAGGASAMWAMGMTDAEIQFRGRWKSLCYKLYIWGSRLKTKGFSSGLFQTRPSLFAAVSAAAAAAAP